MAYAGASVAQWSERSPFTSKVAGSTPSENVLNVTRTQCSTHVKSKISIVVKIASLC